MPISDLSYSHSRDKENGGWRFCSLLKFAQWVSGRTRIHTQAHLTPPSIPSSLCLCFPFLPVLGPTIANRIMLPILVLLWNQTRALVGTQILSLYRSYLHLAGSCFLPVSAEIHTWAPVWCLVNTCEHTQSTLSSNEAIGSQSVTAATLCTHLNVHFPGPQAGASSLLNQLILCLTLHFSTSSSTVFITLPANYSQLLGCLQVNFVTFLIILQHSIDALTC